MTEKPQEPSARSYVDANNNKWTLPINVTTLRRVLDEEKLDLTRSDSGDAMLRLHDEPLLLSRVLYLLLAEEIERRGISPEDFANGLHGESLEKAADALMEGVMDFFPPSKRAAVRTHVRRTKEVQAKLARRAVAKMESPELEALAEQAVDRAIAETFRLIGSSSTTMPESLASIQVP